MIGRPGVLDRNGVPLTPRAGSSAPVGPDTHFGVGVGAFSSIVDPLSTGHLLSIDAEADLGACPTGEDTEADASAHFTSDDAAGHDSTGDATASIDAASLDAGTDAVGLEADASADAAGGERGRSRSRSRTRGGD